MKSWIPILAVLGALAATLPGQASVHVASNALDSGEASSGLVATTSENVSQELAEYLTEIKDVSLTSLEPGNALSGLSAAAEWVSDFPFVPAENIEARHERASIAAWGMGSLALAAAQLRKQKRERTSRRVQLAVKFYLESRAGTDHPFRELGAYLTMLAADPSWTSAEIDSFYSAVVAAIHRSRQAAEVA